jgi:hypothetical protein
MDDIIVIILTLVLTIFAAISQIKKKKQQVPVETGDEPDFWEEILGGGERVSEPVTADIPPTEKRPVSGRQEPLKATAPNAMQKRAMANRQHDHYSDASQEGSRNWDIGARKINNDAFSRVDQTAEDENSILEDFSLKKAIIYTEIIKPKYF